MKVLITGGAGFIGSHLSESMLNDGYSVTVVDDLSTGCLSNIDSLMKRDKFQFVHSSITDMPIMVSLVQNCDIIIHLAAAVGVRLVIEQPIRTIETNVNGSEIVLSLARKFGRKIFMASTSEIYGKSVDTPFREDSYSILGPSSSSRWSYACSKMIDEFLSLAYYDQYGTEVIIGRFFNVIGNRQSGAYGMVVPRFVEAALNGSPLMVYGDGQQQRCFCHVSDVVNVIKKLIICPRAIGEIINIGSDSSITIQELAELIVSMCGSDSDICQISYEKAYGQLFEDIAIRIPDLGKIWGLIDYTLEYSLEQTLWDIILHETELRGGYNGKK